jgi:hypothetical protein
MNQLLLLYGSMVVMVLFTALQTMRTDGTLSQRLARVRIRIEENRRKSLSEPPEEDLKPGRALELLALSILLLLGLTQN